MNPDVPKLPSLPVYDPAKDGNVFAWIVRNAPKARAERQGVEIAMRASQRASLFASGRALNAK
jgi:hypothetical protein